MSTVNFGAMLRHMDLWTTKGAVLRTFLLLMDIDPELIRPRLRAARKNVGLTQEAVAELLDVHKRTIENDETVGEGRAIYGRLSMYARIYNVPIEQLLFGEEVISHEKTELA